MKRRQPLAIPNGDNTAPEILVITPKSPVPMLVHDGVSRTGSINIIKVLDEAFPKLSVHPSTS